MEAAGYRSRAVAEVDPRSEWVRGDEFDTLIVDVSGFTRDQLKVQVEPSGSLKISGERALNGGRQWCHFLKRFDLPGDFDATAIKVQLDKGVLYVQVPRSTDDSQEDTLREEEDAGLFCSGGHTAAWRAYEHPAWRLAKNLGEHRYVVPLARRVRQQQAERWADQERMRQATHMHAQWDSRTAQQIDVII